VEPNLTVPPARPPLGPPPAAGDPPLDERARRTFRYDRVRGACSGILETGWNTFALLVAVRVFEASPSAKALLVAANPLGLLLTPLSLHLATRYGWTPARAAALGLTVAAGCIAAGVLAPNSAWFVAAMVLGSMAAAQQPSLMVGIYTENYPSHRRGRLLSQSIVLAVLMAALYGWLGGAVLDRNTAAWPAVFGLMAAAAAIAAWALRQVPSRAAAIPTTRNPFDSLSYTWRDPVFGGMLGVWMLMGLGNLLVLPLRVEYMANPHFGVDATNAEIALVVAIIPSLVRVVTTHAWGWLFDRFNFFIIRSVLNGLFLIGILLFFHSRSLWALGLAGGFFGLAMAGGNIAWSLWVTKFAPAGKVPAYMSAHTFATGVRGVLAPFVGFYALVAFSAGAVAWVSAGLIALSMVRLGPLRRRAERGAALT
jgi:MFS family permease